MKLRFYNFIHAVIQAKQQQIAKHETTKINLKKNNSKSKAVYNLIKCEKCKYHKCGFACEFGADNASQPERYRNLVALSTVSAAFQSVVLFTKLDNSYLCLPVLLQIFTILKFYVCSSA